MDSESKPGAGVCQLLFGDDWRKCVSPHGRKRLHERVESGELVAYEPAAEWMDQDNPPHGLRQSQIQYQLLTAQLAIGGSYDSADDAPEGVNDALEHIQNAMTQLGELE